MVTGERYRTIIADLPWPYRNSGSRGAAEGEYGVMTIADLCGLGDLVARLADDDAVLLFWTVPPSLREAFAVLDAWGFEYVTKIPWLKLEGAPQRSLISGEYEYKPQYGIGFWGRGCSEDVFVCRRGKPSRPLGAANSLLLLSENFGHSRKPENLYEYAEQFGGPYLELFARRPREGWRAVGNEISGLDIRDELAAMLPIAPGRCFTCRAWGEHERDAETRELVCAICAGDKHRRHHAAYCERHAMEVF